MSMELEMMYTSFLNKWVPAVWQKVSYLSLKPLGSWVDDFVERLEFFGQWLENGKMDSYWVSALFFPQGKFFILIIFVILNLICKYHSF